MPEDLDLPVILVAAAMFQSPFVRPSHAWDAVHVFQVVMVLLCQRQPLLLICCGQTQQK